MFLVVLVNTSPSIAVALGEEGGFTCRMKVEEQDILDIQATTHVLVQLMASRL